MCDFNVQVTFNTQQHTFTFAPSEVTIPKKSTKTICLNLTDNNQDAQTTEHPYKVTVEYGGASYTSDPKIINRG